MAADIDHRQFQRLARRARRLQRLAVAVPTRLTWWLFDRQVRRLEAMLPPPRSHVAETFGRLRFKPEHPVAKVYQAQVERERREAESRQAVDDLRELFRNYLAKPSAHSGSASDR